MREEKFYGKRNRKCARKQEIRIFKEKRISEEKEVKNILENKRIKKKEEKTRKEIKSFGRRYVKERG